MTPLEIARHTSTTRGVDATGGLCGMARWYVSVMRLRGYSEESIRVREHHLRHLTNWLLERGITRVTEVDRAHLLAYQRRLANEPGRLGRPRMHVTQGLHIISVRRFFSHLLREGHVAINPAADLELPFKSRRLPRDILTWEEVQRIFAICDLATPGGLRDRTIFELLYTTGLRRSETAVLSVVDVDLPRDALIVRQGKGRKDRFLPLGPRLREWLFRYLEEARPALTRFLDPGTLFVTDTGLAYTPNHVGDVARRHFRKAGITKPGACHLFRHSMATAMMEAGCDIRLIQALLGHSDMGTTAIYTHVTIRHLADALNRFHPTLTPPLPREENDIREPRDPNRDEEADRPTTV